MADIDVLKQYRLLVERSGFSESISVSLGDAPLGKRERMYIRASGCVRLRYVDREHFFEGARLALHYELRREEAWARLVSICSPMSKSGGTWVVRTCNEEFAKGGNVVLAVYRLATIWPGLNSYLAKTINETETMAIDSIPERDRNDIGSGSMYELISTIVSKFAAFRFVD